MRNKVNKSGLAAWLLFAFVTVAIVPALFTWWADRQADQTVLYLASEVLWLVLPAEFAFLAALILSRQPRHVIGWLVMIPAMALAIDNNVQDFFNGFTTVPPAQTPAIMLAIWFHGWSWLLLMFPIFFIFLLFPTGGQPHHGGAGAPSISWAYVCSSSW